MKARPEAPKRASSEISPGALPAHGLPATNGVNKGLNGESSPEMLELLHALQAMRTGDFSVRMRGDHVGLAGKIACSGMGYNISRLVIIGVGRYLEHQVLRKFFTVIPDV